MISLRTGGKVNVRNSLIAKKVLIFLLVVSLVCIQAIRLHVHLYDHQHDIVTTDTHSSSPHSVFIPLQSGDHDEVIMLDLTHAFTKKIIAFYLPIVALMLIIAFVAVFNLTDRKFRQFTRCILCFQRYSLPPLRAPPISL